MMHLYITTVTNDNNIVAIKNLNTVIVYVVPTVASKISLHSAQSQAPRQEP